MNKIPKEIKELAKRNGVTMDALYKRIERGMEHKEAATKPIRSYPKLYEQYRDVAEENGVSENLFRLRLHRGMTPEDAATKPNPRAKHKNVKVGSSIIHDNETYEVTEVIKELDEIVAVHPETGEEVFLEKGHYRLLGNPSNYYLKPYNDGWRMFKREGVKSIHIATFFDEKHANHVVGDLNIT